MVPTCVSVYAPPLGDIIAGKLRGDLLFVGESRQGEPGEVDHRHGGHNELRP